MTTDLSGLNQPSGIVKVSDVAEAFKTDPTNPYPIPQNRVWEIFDSSKIQCFQDCPRKYLLQYMLGWQLTSANLHLVFGEAWHQAKEHMIRNRFTEACVGSAFAVFLNYYRQFFPEETDAIYSKYAKKPVDALLALQYYRDKYAHEADESNREYRELLHTEVAGTVPINTDRVLHFRLDALFRTINGILVQEHKTASRRSDQWNDQWYLKIQIGTYTHVAHMLFPNETIFGLEINGMCFYKAETANHNKQESVRIPVNRSKDMMADWLWTANHWLNQIEWNMEALKDATDSDDILSCFPKNGQSCTDYFGCEFHPYCMIWANPLRHIEEPPPGFTTKWWDPSERQDTAKTVVHLENE